MGTKYQSFRNLIVYEKSYSLGNDIFELSKSFPENEQYSLTSQIRRSSRSIAANIGEAWAYRKYPKSFIHKLNISYGEASETGIWLNFARDHGYLEIKTHDDYFERSEEIQKMLRSMMNQPEKFCYHKE